MSVITNADAQQAAYENAVAAAEALPHQPPIYRQSVIVTRNDLQGNPTQAMVGAVVYDAQRKKIKLETTNDSGGVTGSVELEIDCVDAFFAALQALRA
jgi:hypothetical protein